MKYRIIYKNRGETPREAITRFQEKNPQWNGTPLSYAGRLDPMAEGKLLILFGDECKKQKLYTKLDKVYDITVLFDLCTDTGDILGIPSYTQKNTHPTVHTIRTYLREQEHGTHIREYPRFSSKTVAGTPLFLYTLLGTIDSITIPSHKETIYRTRVSRVVPISKDALKKEIEDGLRIVPRSDEPSKTVGADFRQDTIRKSWEDLFNTIPERTFFVAHIRVVAGSGAYMRTLSERIGKGHHTGALALSIKRTTIGKYQKLPFGFGFWIKKY